MSDELMPMFSADGHVDEGTIHTWLDGAFDDAAELVVQTHVEGCATCQAAVAVARGFVAGASRLTRALDVVPSKIVPSDDVARVASRIVAAAAPMRDAESGAIPSAPVVSRPTRPWFVQPVFRAAAALLVLVGGTAIVLREGGVTTVAVVSGPAKESADRIVPSAAPTVTSAHASSPVAEPSRPKTTMRAKQDKRAMPAPTVSPIAPPPSVASVAVTDATVDARKAEAFGNSGAPAAVVIGRVVGSGNRPIRDARLIANSVPSQSTVTDSLGQFVMRVRGDTANLIVRRLGYEPLRTSLRLIGRDTVRTQLTLEQQVVALSEVVVQDAAAATTQCWTLRSESPAGPQRLPVHLETPDLQSTKGLLVRLIGWPDSASRTSASADVDVNGAFSMTRVSGDRAVSLSLHRNGIEWRGSAIVAERATRNTVVVTMTPVSATVCKP